MKPFPTSAACCFGILFISVSLITTGSSEVQVVGSADPVVALAGDDIILPCFLKPRVNAKDMVVKWTRFNLTTTEDVHLYRDGRVDHFPSYSERTSLFNDELKNGNVSLKLTRVTLSDAGRYRCFIPTLTSQVKETTVQLFVGAVSQPVISIDGTKGWGVVLKCESGGWYPEPEMEWLDSSGSILPADGPPERNRDSEGLYTVRQHVTVDKTDTNRFTCIVQQPEINHLKETEIHVPDEVFPKSQVGLIVGLITAAVGVLAAVGVYMWRKHKEKKLKEQDSFWRNEFRRPMEELRMQIEKKLKKELEEQVYAQFVDVSRDHLIQNVTMVIPIAFYLIRSEKYSQIHAAGTREDQMRLLYEALDSGGEKLKSDFYRILQDLQPDLVLDLDQVSRLMDHFWRMDPFRKENEKLKKENDELKEELRKAKETIKTLSTSPGGQQKTQTPSQKSEGIEDEGMEKESLPGSGRKSLLGSGMEMKPLLGPGMEMKPLLGPGPQKDDLDEMERGGIVTTDVQYRAAVGLL